jgi:hypothetical protein
LKFTLLTNIDFVQDMASLMRLNANALLLTQNADPRAGIFGPNYSLRGFGTDCYSEIFNLSLASTEFPYAIESPVADETKLFLGLGGEPRPIFAGSILRLGACLFFLQHADREQSIDVFENDEIEPVWRTLRSNVAKFWPYPYITYGHQISAEAMRALHDSV